MSYASDVSSCCMLKLVFGVRILIKCEVLLESQSEVILFKVSETFARNLTINITNATNEQKCNSARNTLYIDKFCVGMRMFDHLSFLILNS